MTLNIVFSVYQGKNDTYRLPKNKICHTSNCGFHPLAMLLGQWPFTTLYKLHVIRILTTVLLMVNYNLCTSTKNQHVSDEQQAITRDKQFYFRTYSIHPNNLAIN